MRSASSRACSTTPSARSAAATAELAADRARMQAILGGMIEGVVVVNEQGRLQLANAAAQRMLRLDATQREQHYLEIVRHPDIAAQIGTALDRHRDRRPGADAAAASPGRSSLRGARRSPRARRAAPSWCCTTSPTCAAPTRSAATSSPTCRTNSGRRSPRCAATSRRCSTGSSDPEQSRRFLETVARHTLRMERLVRDLLRLARLDAGQETLERVPCAVHALFKGVETDLAEAASARNISMRHDIVPERLTVTGDPAKLHDALRNLLENAINYSPDARHDRPRRTPARGPGRDHRHRPRPGYPGGRPRRGYSSASTVSTSHARAAVRIPAGPASASRS